MCFIVDEPSQVWKQTIVRARVKHVCDECIDGILPGECYERTGSLLDGRWETFRTCARCYFDRERVIAKELSEGCAPHESVPMIGELREAMGRYAEDERWERSQQGEDESRWDEPTSWEPSPVTYRGAAA